MSGALRSPAKFRPALSLGFGKVCGIAPGGIPAHSCDYDNVDPAECAPRLAAASCPLQNVVFDSVYRYTSRSQFRHLVNGLYYGYKYQCVEFARRWLIHAQGITFGDVGMAYEIYDIPHATRVRGGGVVQWTAHPNGSSTRPVAGSVILWNEGGEFQWTGHVAIATAVSDTYLRIAEQNVEDCSWQGKDYARELAVSVDASGSYKVRETWGRKGGTIKGWLNVPAGFVAEPIPYTIPFTLP